jgi:hypothetical protein
MKNSFKKILTTHEVPKVLKNKILDDISMIRRTFDISDIFLIKYPGTLSDFYIHEEISNR